MRLSSGCFPSKWGQLEKQRRAMRERANYLAKVPKVQAIIRFTLRRCHVLTSLPSIHSILLYKVWNFTSTWLQAFCIRQIKDRWRDRQSCRYKYIDIIDVCSPLGKCARVNMENQVLTRQFQEIESVPRIRKTDHQHWWSNTKPGQKADSKKCYKIMHLLKVSRGKLIVQAESFSRKIKP